ncbi:DUF4189 domain-containing protein [Acinetobacter colistiniresistens]|uniref:DUF4189 domain-containing protein n=1 Tax=Acinetobacter colistiniresistens TaxID=280145 RepID=UPI001D182E6A|nr:DUF4189 domain-containing protein [Acinetobacter colistiniresistens]
MIATSSNQLFKLPIFVALIIFFGFEYAHAEGNCPPGYYPIGGQGVQGCALIPGGTSGGNTNDSPTLYPSVEILWGAIAEDKSKGLKGRAFGSTRNFKSKEEAQINALKGCQKDGGQKCELSHTYKNGCVAVADPIKGGQESEIKFNVSEDKAKEAAMVFCSLNNQQSCRIVYSGCSL